VTVGIRRSYPQPIPLPRPAGALRSEFITVEEISGTTVRNGICPGGF
jgi:hypothetical protein